MKNTNNFNNFHKKHKTILIKNTKQIFKFNLNYSPVKMCHRPRPLAPPIGPALLVPGRRSGSGRGSRSRTLNALVRRRVAQK